MEIKGINNEDIEKKKKVIYDEIAEMIKSGELTTEEDVNNKLRELIEYYSNIIL
ncbi:MAG: hypothetical protein GX287_05170 [Fusobacteria bacterium]|nr:hypothetical protein [Fusobacteriota bacterium]